jgi:hypothetical protein
MDTQAKRTAYRAVHMAWLQTPAARARVCVGCHVGAAADAKSGLPVRDVDHVMIAAGHPRLMFEFSSYLANLPKHWSEKAKNREEFEIRTWLVGQLVSAQQALQLRADRAGRAGWPEFAEYDCYACHHDLQQPSRRQETAPAAHRPGSLRAGSWYFGLLSSGLGLLGEGRATLGELTNAIEKPLVRNLELIARDAHAASRQLDPLIEELDTAAMGDVAARRLMTLLRERGRSTPAWNWDELEQAGLGLIALDFARRDALPHPDGQPVHADKAIQSLVHVLAPQVEGPRSRHDSDFGAALRAVFERIDLTEP